jgi:CheY-like chemotaxis protein/HPt (histidine-containing phosphotransfer) domain-containing protein
VELMGGRIRARSQPGAGSTFYFTARFGLGTAESGRPAAAAEADLEAIRLDGLSILLADDSEDNRFLILSYLKDTGCIVDLAENGAVAVSRFESERYDIVLMDVEMPVLDGYTAVRRIRELEGVRGSPAVPVLALTAHALTELKARSLEAGFTAHLSKPVRRAVLLEAIRRHVPEAAQTAGPKRIHVPVDPMLRAIVPAFLEKRRNEVPEFLDALDREDFDRIRVLGHNLKGCGAGYGFPPLSEIGAAIEKAAEQRNAGETRHRVEELARYLEAVDPQYPG